MTRDPQMTAITLLRMIITMQTVILTIVHLDVLIRKEILHDRFVQLVCHLDLYGSYIHLKMFLH